MKISKIIKVFYFPRFRIDHPEMILAENILRAVRKDWKIKILILLKQQQNPLSFLDLQHLEGQSLISLFRRERIEIQDFPKEINHALSSMLAEYIRIHHIGAYTESFQSTRHHIIKGLSQELVDYTKRKKILPITAQGITSYFPASFISAQPKTLFYIPKHHYRKCVKSCRTFLRHLNQTSASPISRDV